MHIPNKRERATAAVLLVFLPVVVLGVTLWNASESAREVAKEVFTTPVPEFWAETKSLYRGLWRVAKGKPLSWN